ncbi:MAG: flavodoxin-dependent (E)-4-hydroxy-3-methylbut-2-enyl-diphosphate synthase [Sedimentisphaerales bacterium]|nr:flavodoxin-dependent (E)-4-hydroxy-3-methylbut-2-enyl-diphosphate synthase [Sedimentisphaerales bacterium]
MYQRKKSRPVRIGSIQIGAGLPVAVQSMTKVQTTDVDRCLEQIGRLTSAGCRLVRLAVPRRADTQALVQIVRQVQIPIIADVHFSAQRAIEAIEAGSAKVRINPGNMSREDILTVVDAAKANGVAIRLGVNEASIRDLSDDVPPNKRVRLMISRIREYVQLCEDRGFDQLVISAKSSDPIRTIQTNRAIARSFDYPIHIGLTHAGLPEDAAILSAVTLGTLLAEGIGDTIRVSAAGDPVEEVHVAYAILEALGLAERRSPELVVCPTCGRTEIDLLALARKVKASLQQVPGPVRVAVMGCVVNGPGEAADADIAICGGKGKAFLYHKGKKVTVVPEAQLADAVQRMIAQLSRVGDHATAKTKV